MLRAMPVAIALSLAAVSCGQAGRDVAVDPVGSSSLPTLPPPGGPQIDWSNPILDGVPTTRAQARSVGRLSFDPFVPRFSVPEKYVRVTNPALGSNVRAAVAFVYEFPLGPGLPTDGRVVVIQAPTDMTESDLATVAESNDAEHYRLVTIGGHPALLVEANGVGRVRMVRDGVAIDVTGPATPPETVLRLAADVV